ncbi:MAG TPA: hypothetical protein DDZ80_02810 [Cyanobacteria bacterium UBA8803]|nr:hypothetical protein [Cyanobacteria bacterium UBA9273]HBL57509.1 hypothetical protein [Cyanobacteria bacterium UBA8803]
MLTNYQSPITNHQLPITNHQLLNLLITIDPGEPTLLRSHRMYPIPIFWRWVFQIVLGTF